MLRLLFGPRIFRFLVRAWTHTVDFASSCLVFVLSCLCFVLFCLVLWLSYGCLVFSWSCFCHCLVFVLSCFVLFCLVLSWLVLCCRALSLLLLYNASDTLSCQHPYSSPALWCGLQCSQLSATCPQFSSSYPIGERNRCELHHDSAMHHGREQVLWPRVLLSSVYIIILIVFSILTGILYGRVWCYGEMIVNRVILLWRCVAWSPGDRYR
jgi:hypothetical protein